jgi:hypothetical protein
MTIGQRVFSVDSWCELTHGLSPKPKRYRKQASDKGDRLNYRVILPAPFLVHFDLRHTTYYLLLLRNRTEQCRNRCCSYTGP